MRHLIPGIALGLAVAFGASASANEIYQWKDANGVTHYSETPPPGGVSYQQRRITHSGASVEQSQTAAPGTAAAAAAEAPAANPQCAAARSNIEALQGDGAVQQDDGSGNLRELSADDRANQLELAHAAVKAYCTDDDAPAN